MSVPYDLYPSHTKYTEVRQVYMALTVNEVAAGWHKHPKTVILAIQNDRLTARRAGRNWLISYASVVRRWGKPLERDLYDENEYELETPAQPENT